MLHVIYMSVNSYAYHHPTAQDTHFQPAALPDLLARTTARNPQAPFLHFLGRTYAYREILAEARRFAAGLIARGIAPGDRVGLFLPNVPIYASAYYGAMMAGAVVVNFSPLYTAHELAAQVEDSGARLLVTLDVASLLPTAIEVLDASRLETVVAGRLGQMLPFAKWMALQLLGRAQRRRQQDQ